MRHSLLERFDTQIAICSALGMTATIAAPQQEADADDIVYYQPNGGAGWVEPATVDGLYVNVETQTAGTTEAAVPGWDLIRFGDVSLRWFRNATSGSNFAARRAGP